MKKIFYLILCLAVLAASFAIFASAESEFHSNISESASAPTESAAQAENRSEPSASEDNTSDSEKEAGKNIFTEIYATCLNHSSEIFATLACAFSAALILIFKKSVIPLIKGGLNALSGGVEALSAEAKKNSEQAGSIRAALADGASYTDASIAELTRLAKEIEGQLLEGKSYKSSIEQFRSVLENEVTLLYEILMASSIPQFEKERVAQLISTAKTRSLISEAPADEEN